ncbi:MAG: hypothetical protein V7688_08070 [Alcanivorax jadensis]|uniref:hypothetical protein n=1 Tax=Alcanivorax jadensis TaxID=64988 RepID=UPI0030031D7D
MAVRAVPLCTANARLLAILKVTPLPENTITLSMELTEKVEHIRDLTALDAAEELVRLPADDIQFILSRLPASQAVAIASHLGEVAAPDSAASIAVLSGMEASIGELMTPVTATLPQSTTVAEATQQQDTHQLADLLRI